MNAAVDGRAVAVVSSVVRSALVSHSFGTIL